MRRLWQQKDEERSSDGISVPLGNTMLVFGAATVLLMLLTQTSKDWFMVSDRPFARSLHMRVIGPDSVVEAGYHLEADYFYNFEEHARQNVWPMRREFSLAARQGWFCDNQGRTVQLSDKDRGFLGLDWEDMNLTGPSTIFPCDRSVDSVATVSFRNIIPPAPRLTHTSPVSMEEYTPVQDKDLILRYDVGCADLRDNQQSVVSPPGYKECPESDWNQCAGSDTKLEPAFCVDRLQLGQPLHNMTMTPTYVQANSFTNWKKPGTRTISDKTGPDAEPVFREPHFDANKWCHVTDVRCTTFTQFTSSGETFHLYLLCSTVLAVVGFGISLGWLRIPWLSDVSGCLFAISGVLMLYGSVTYRQAIAQALSQSMSPIDAWGRPFIHPFKDYPGDIKKGEWANAEWLWDKRQAMVDYTVFDPSNPQGYTTLWAAHLSIVCGIMALVVAVVCGELFFTRHGASPLLSLLHLLLLPFIFAFHVVKALIDRFLLKHSASDTFWYQKFYPRAFTAGRWLHPGLDQLWDWGLMLPVHALRAMCDFVTCQSISSPQEKVVLEEQGITNKKMQSLMSRRRSHFVVAFALGLVMLCINFNWVTHLLPLHSLQHRPALAHDVTYPMHRCNYWNGNCREQIGDLTSLTAYVMGGLRRIYAVRMLHIGDVDMTKIFIEWVAGFAAVCCAIGALLSWTELKVSRRLNLMGWALLVFTPVLTSIIPESPAGREETKQAMIQNGAEIWGELLNYFSRGCDQIVGDMTDLAHKGDEICKWAQSSDMVQFIPMDLRNGCNDYRTRYAASYSSDKLPDMEEPAMMVCHWARGYIEDEDAPKNYTETVDFIAERADLAVDLLYGYTVQAASMNKALQALPHLLGIIPAVMQAILMAKNVVPGLSLSHLGMILPCGFVVLSWTYVQLFYQIWTGPLFYICALTLALGPLLYVVLANMSHLRQPMDDKQSFTVTNGIWWYVFIFTRFLPFVGIVIYFTFFVAEARSVQASLGYWSWSRMYHDNFIVAIIGFFSTLALIYVSTLQAVTDFFIMQAVEQHVSSHAPMVLHISKSKHEAEMYQQRLMTDIDLDQIVKGTYVCEAKQRKPKGWQKQTKIWAWDLASKDLETLDEFASQLRSQDRLQRILKQARKVYYNLMIQRLPRPGEAEPGESMIDPGEFSPGDMICLNGRQGRVEGINEDGTIAVRWLDTNEEENVIMPTMENLAGSTFNTQQGASASDDDLVSAPSAFTGATQRQSDDARQHHTQQPDIEGESYGTPGASPDGAAQDRRDSGSRQHARTFQGGDDRSHAQARGPQQPRTFAGAESHLGQRGGEQQSQGDESHRTGNTSWTLASEYDQDQAAPAAFGNFPGQPGGPRAHPTAAAPPRPLARGDPQLPPGGPAEAPEGPVAFGYVSSAMSWGQTPVARPHPHQGGELAQPLVPEQAGSAGTAGARKSQRGAMAEAPDAPAREVSASEEQSDEEWNDAGAAMSDDSEPEELDQIAAALDDNLDVRASAPPQAPHGGSRYTDQGSLPPAASAQQGGAPGRHPSPPPAVQGRTSRGLSPQHGQPPSPPASPPPPGHDGPAGSFGSR